MADRTLQSEWPSYVNSSGVPGTGTKITAELLDGILDALLLAIYDPSLEDDPPSIAREVSGARGVYASLDARLDALEALASGGAATAAVPGQMNLVPNGNFLIWGEGVTSAPSYFGSTGSPTFAAVSARGGADSAKIVGPYYCNMTSAGGARDLYIDLLQATDLSADGSFPLAGQEFAAGVFVKTSTSGSVSIYIDDGVSEKLLAANTHSDGTWAWVSGSTTLSSSASKLRLIVRLSAAITVGLSGLCAYASDSAPRYIPPQLVEGDIVYAEPGAAVATGLKAYWTPGRPIFVKSVDYSCQSGSGTVAITNDGLSVFATDLGVTTTPATEYPQNLNVASFGATDTLAINVTASSSLTTPSVRVRYVAFSNPFAAVRSQIPVS